MNLINRLWNINFDSYIVFNEDLAITKESWVVRKNDLWANKYQLSRVDIRDDKQCVKLAELWYLAFSNCNSIENAEKIILNMYLSGSYCFVAQTDKKFVGMLWLGDNNNFMFNKIGSFLKNESNKSVYHHIFVLPDARGSNIQSALRILAMSSAVSRGDKKIYAFVGCKNFSSINNFLSFSDSYRLIQHVAIDIGPFKFNFHPNLSVEKWNTINNPAASNRKYNHK